MKKIAYYIRTSTAEQTPELQIKDIDTICNEPHEILREQQSAWAENTSRPVFNSVKELIKKGKIKELYVWDIDRLQRNRKRLQQFFILCNNYGCKVFSYRQSWLNSLNEIPPPFDELMFELLIGIFGWIAEEESDKKSERVKMAVKRQKDGTFSYKGNKWGRKALPKQTINRILELYDEGMSVRKIASQVKVYDKNNHGKNISTTSVHRTITEHRKTK